MSLVKNQEIQLHIDGVTSEGSGVGRYDGQAVFVANSFIGDELLVHIIKAKKSYAVGKIVKIIKPSEDRIEISYMQKNISKKLSVELSNIKLIRLAVKF